jgi:hypothetical protein
MSPNLMVLVKLYRDKAGVVRTTCAIDVQRPCSAVVAQIERSHVRSEDEFALALALLFHKFGIDEPFLPSSVKVLSVECDGFDVGEVLACIPRNRGNAHWLVGHGGLCFFHGNDDV